MVRRHGVTGLGVCMLALAVIVGVSHAGGDGGACAPARADGVRLRVARIVLGQAPKMVRSGAELYCLRLEMLRNLLTKDEYNQEMEDLVARFAKTVETLGLDGLDLFIALRKEIPHGHIKQAWKRMRDRIQPGKGGGRQVAAQAMAAHRNRLRTMVAQVERLHRNLELSEAQRLKMKLIALAWVPDLVRAGGDVVAEGLALAGEMMKGKVERTACAQRVGALGGHVRKVGESVARLAFALKAELSARQRERLGANIPLRLLLLR